MRQSKKSQKPILIGLGGKAASGKTTASNFLINQKNFVPIKLAGPLKSMLSKLIELQGGDVPEWIEGARKEETCPYLGGKTPRLAMQTLGTEWGRNNMGSDFWVDIAANRIKIAMNKGCNVVVDDVRFPNELAMVRQLGGRLLYLRRDEAAQIETYGHASEVSIGGQYFDQVIPNSDTMIDLFEELNQQLKMAAV